MSDIPYSVRDSVTNINKVRGFNFDTIGDNEMFKKVDATNVGGTNLISLETADSNILNMNIDNATFKGLAGRIEAQIVGTIKKLYLNSSGDKADGITVTSDRKVGINVVEPNEELQIEGTLRIDDDTTQTLTFYDIHGGSIKEHGRIELTDNGGGADMLIYTRPSGGTNPTEKLRISKEGAIGIGGANYGTEGDVIISNGSGNSVSYRSLVYLAAYKTTNTDVSFAAGSGATYIIRDMTIDYISDAGSYNTSTGEFTAPRQAFYVINYSANIYDDITGGAYSGYISCEVKVDRGSGFVVEMVQNYYDKSLNTENFTPNLTYLTQLNAGDKVINECSFFSTSATTVTIRGHTTSKRCTFQSIHSIT
jgi:hypothetical protein